MTRRSRAALAAVALTVPLAAGCGAGADAQTHQVYAPGDGVLRITDTLRIQNALVVAPPGNGDRAVVSMAIANIGDRPERLVGIDVGDAGSGVRLTGPTAIPAGGSVNFGGPEAAAQAVISGFRRRAGEYVPLSLRFERGALAPIPSPVLPPNGEYARVIAPGATPADTPSESTSPSPSDPANPEQPVSPTATASASPPQSPGATPASPSP